MSRPKRKTPSDRWAFIHEPQLELPETIAPEPVPREPFEMEALSVGSYSWIGDPRLAPVADQLPYNTCAANSSCRLLETLAAIAGSRIQVEAHIFHECVVGLNAMVGPGRMSDVLEPLQATGAPEGRQGSFIPGSPCPNPLPRRFRAATFARIGNDSDAKYWIATKSPVIAVISAEDRFKRVRDWSIYRDTGPSSFNHALLLVGFDDGEACWHVQNSFGTGWGRNGFGRIAYGHCGILRDDAHGVFRLS